MNWRIIGQMTGVLIAALGCSMALPLVWSLICADGSSRAFALSMALCGVVGGLLFFPLRKPLGEGFSQKEGMAIVGLGWMAVGLFGAFPFFFSGFFWGFTDAVFESVSGFTTTGASVLEDIESLPQGLLLWRSQIQWIGGMGIILFSIAILPFLGVGGMQLYKAEVPSPVPDKLKPRIQETAKILWKVYLFFSLLLFFLLLAGGMGGFDSLCHTFTTMPTGGFSTKNLSIAHFDSLYIEVVIMAFMVLAGINFTLHFQFLRRGGFSYFNDAECRFFLVLLLAIMVGVFWILWGATYESPGESLRYGAFQVISIVTTTGFATADYVLWAPAAQLILLFAMFTGACAGSTSGGMKTVRLMICGKYGYKELFFLVHPRAVREVKLGGRVVPGGVIHGVLGFMALYLGVYVAGSLLLAAQGTDAVTALTAAASALGNVGPGFGGVGPAENYAGIPQAGKWVLSWLMLMGRLEIYTLIIFLVPEFWRN
ncbi:TrkH family potassium uptake protein [Desulfobotulus sp. H1]|uniref:TrkH family potassium uptake protein n=1 Tax=Desulfobotulus pelophilus TaxID=2823377 RepID=A0ABT3N5U0_9BACT|nr:potassium transporter TrkG [Desulfobotulus pelophilus]MCW7752402.1 TrkH family potassium uptake protein [Desulfobotulus pelophilus]